MARSGIALTVLVVGLSMLACADAVGNETSNGSTTYELIDVPLAREAQVAQTLSTIIQSPTVADRDAPQHVSNGVPFEEMHADLAAAFPELYEVVDVELINNYSLLYTWEGSDPSLRPLLLISHQDVVPAPIDNWTVDPFSGHIDDKYVWGRGTLDTKGSGVAILEAWEQLRSQGWTPTRTILFGFGHDEEVGGRQGAAYISNVLEERYPEGLEMILDEGGFTLTDGLGEAAEGLLSDNAGIASVGMGEKGKESWDFFIRGAGGHSSMPPPPGTSTTATLGALLTMLNDRLLPARLQPPVTDFLSTIAPYVKSREMAYVLSQPNSPTFAPLLTQLLASIPITSTMVRTSHGVVGADAGGQTRNAMPTSASITVDFRTLANGGDEVEEFIAGIMADLEVPDTGSVEVVKHDAFVNASAITPASGPRFEAVRRAILETIPSPGGPPVLVMPYLMSGGTDSKNYERLARERIFRYEPFAVPNDDLPGIHGVDERISIESYIHGIKFYIRFTQLVADGALTDDTPCPSSICAPASEIHV